MKAALGITFSPPHLEELDLSAEKALTDALKYNFSHIRLGTYWNRIEKSPGNYDFKELHSILNRCQKAKQAVILTVGVKAPRWPEYYWPEFIAHKNTQDHQTQNKLLKFIEQVVKDTQSFECITHWQVENEPFDPSGPENLAISANFLEQELALVKSLDSRPVLVSLWGNDLLLRGFFKEIPTLTDEVGIDLYYKKFVTQLFGKNIYKGPNQTDGALRKLIKSSQKPIWITELQAEPWEKSHEGYFSSKPGSISPEKLKNNILRASKLSTKEILLWGFEYWLWQKQRGNTDYFQIIDEFVSQKT